MIKAFLAYLTNISCNRFTKKGIASKKGYQIGDTNLNKEKDIDKFVKDIFAKSSSKGAHSYDHTRRVYSLAIEIGKIV